MINQNAVGVAIPEHISGEKYHDTSTSVDGVTYTQCAYRGPKNTGTVYSGQQTRYVDRKRAYIASIG